MANTLAAFHRARRALGVKGFLLLLLSLAWSLRAYSIASGSEQTAVTPDPALFHLDLPIWARITLWGGCAVAAAFCAVANAPQYQGVGYAFAFIPPAERAASYFGSWVVHLLTDGSAGVAGAWVPASTWAIAATMVLCMALIKEQRTATT